tara:strand:- start:2274 stop:2411 length:138 start_codon:yes stop_codon:yes gene_type:complete
VEVKILTSIGRPVLDREARATDRDNWRSNRGRGAGSAAPVARKIA